MNLPNKLTVLRVLMIPVFLFFFFATWVPGNYFWAFLTFALASLTDTLDGMIARKYNLVTDFGKLMDPLADKLLTISAFICLLGRSELGRVFLIIIISREFIVTSIRLVAAEKAVVIAADKWGKLKTITQMVWICQALLALGITNLPSGLYEIWSWLDYLLLAVAIALTVGSGINYAIKNRRLFANR